MQFQGLNFLIKASQAEFRNNAFSKEGNNTVTLEVSLEV